MRNLFRNCCVCAALLVVCATVSFGQAPAQGRSESIPAAATPAYAELLLLKTELSSELESLIVDYTEDYPKIKELRYVLTLLDRDLARLAKIKAADISRLTLALGKLMVRRIELETDLWKLRESYKDEHPEVKRAKRKVELYEKAIGEILG